MVVDHDSGRLVWAAPGRDTATLRGFFDALGAGRCAQITHVSADAADWIADVVTERRPDAIMRRSVWWPGPLSRGCQAPRLDMTPGAGPHRTQVGPRPTRQQRRAASRARAGPQWLCQPEVAPGDGLKWPHVISS